MLRASYVIIDILSDVWLWLGQLPIAGTMAVIVNSNAEKGTGVR